MIYLIAMSLAFLVPLLPAFILYKNLPSTAVVSGPFKGLTIQLSGAFGGYFLLTLIAFGYLAVQSKPATTDELWEVNGSLIGEDGSPLDNLKVSMLPTTYDLTGDGSFTVRVPAKRDTSGNVWFPKLVFEAANLKTTTMDLNGENRVVGDHWKLSLHPEMKKISVNDPIKLPLIKTPYQPNVPPPQLTHSVSDPQEVANVRK